MASKVRSRSASVRPGIVLGASVAVGVGWLVASVISRDEAAGSDRFALASVAAVEPAPVPAVVAHPKSARSPSQIPSELFLPHSLAIPLTPAVPPQTTPVPLPAPPEVTGSIPAANAIPLPRKRVVPEAKPDANRAESPTAQIARIKATLKLTPSQEAYWPPVEAALRDILTQLGSESGLAHGATYRSGPPPAIDQDKVQRLTSAAMPLLMTFDESQRREVRRLARIMGLENVASAI